MQHLVKFMFQAGPAFDTVHVSLFVAGAAVDDVWYRSTKVVLLNFHCALLRILFGSTADHTKKFFSTRSVLSFFC